MIRIRSRFLGLAALALSVVSLTACGSTDSETTAPTIKEFESANFTEATDTLKAGSTISFYGSVSDEVGLKGWSLQVLDADGDLVYTATVPTISGKTSQDFDIDAGDTKLQITNDGKWDISGKVAANYTVRLTVTNTNGQSTTKDMKIIAAKSVDVVTTPLTLVAQGISAGGKLAKPGSSISLSLGKALLASDLTSNRTAIDLVVTSDDANNAIFESTAQAVSNGDLSDAAWGTGNGTLIALVSKEPTTLEEAKAITLSAQSALIQSAGASYVAKTVSGTYYVLTVTNVTGGGDEVSFTLKILK